MKCEVKGCENETINLLITHDEDSDHYICDDCVNKYFRRGTMSEDKVIRIKKETLLDQFQQWLVELVFPGKVEDFVQEVKGFGDDNQATREIVIYTEDHEYYITAREEKRGEGYLGCNVLARKSRAGEDWQRGNDLPDGPLNKETWNRIIYAIVNYELVKLTPFKKPDTLPNGIA